MHTFDFSIDLCMSCGNHLLVNVKITCTIEAVIVIFRTTSYISNVHFKTIYSKQSYVKRILHVDKLWETKSYVRYFDAFVSLLIVLIVNLNIILWHQYTTSLSFAFYFYICMNNGRFKMGMCFPYSVMHGFHSFGHLSHRFLGHFWLSCW